MQMSLLGISAVISSVLQRTIRPLLFVSFLGGISYDLLAGLFV